MNPKQFATFQITLFNEMDRAYKRFTGNILRKLIHASQEMNPGSQIAGYYFRGMAYYLDTEGKPYETSMQYLPHNTLPPSLPLVLHPKHEEWLGYQQRYSATFPRIKQGLSVLLSRAQTAQDLRDMLPEHLITLVLSTDLLSGLKRTRPDVYPAGVADPEEEPEKHQAALDERLDCWDHRFIDAYRPIGPLIDQYMGYKYLA